MQSFLTRKFFKENSLNEEKIKNKFVNFLSIFSIRNFLIQFIVGISLIYAFQI